MTGIEVPARMADSSPMNGPGKVASETVSPVSQWDVDGQFRIRHEKKEKSLSQSASAVGRGTPATSLGSLCDPFKQSGTRHQLRDNSPDDDGAGT